MNLMLLEPSLGFLPGPGLASARCVRPELARVPARRPDRRPPGNLVHGWSAALAGDRELAALSAAVTERVWALVEACPERRDLVHGDLLYGKCW